MIEKWATQALALTLTVVGRVTGPPGATDRDDRDRGDVPGWVMITVMTAIVVVALVAVFQKQVLDAVRSAFGQVNDSGKP